MDGGVCGWWSVCVVECVWMVCVDGGVCVDGVFEARGWRELEGT